MLHQRLFQEICDAIMLGQIKPSTEKLHISFDVTIQRVYLKSGCRSPSFACSSSESSRKWSRLPRSLCLFSHAHHPHIFAAVTIPTNMNAIQVEIPGMYCGSSFFGKTKAEMIPPICPQLMANAVTVPRLVLPMTWLVLFGHNC
jgi:hypothetical protein